MVNVFNCICLKLHFPVLKEWTECNNSLLIKTDKWRQRSVYLLPLSAYLEINLSLLILLNLRSIIDSADQKIYLYTMTDRKISFIVIKIFLKNISMYKIKDNCLQTNSEMHFTYSYQSHFQTIGLSKFKIYWISVLQLQLGSPISLGKLLRSVQKNDRELAWFVKKNPKTFFTIPCTIPVI